MSAIASEIDQTLRTLDPQRASALEQAFRAMLSAVRVTKSAGTPEALAPRAVDANGWPLGYWESVVGCLADDDWEPPSDLPPDPCPEDVSKP